MQAPSSKRCAVRVRPRRSRRRCGREPCLAIGCKTRHRPCITHRRCCVPTTARWWRMPVGCASRPAPAGRRARSAPPHRHPRALAVGGFGTTLIVRVDGLAVATIIGVHDAERGGRKPLGGHRVPNPPAADALDAMEYSAVQNRRRTLPAKTAPPPSSRPSPSMSRGHSPWTTCRSR